MDREKWLVEEWIQMQVQKQVNDVLDKIRTEILEEAEYAYADFDEYKEDILHAEADELPDDDFRYGLERAIEIINKYKAESEERDEMPLSNESNP